MGYVNNFIIVITNNIAETKSTPKLSTSLFSPRHDQRLSLAFSFDDYTRLAFQTQMSEEKRHVMSLSPSGVAWRRRVVQVWTTV